ncbi:hypothetical protein KDA14_05860, partial [Candidatus Saccharibacteria bacterium]|nr:hypothetical protein [Candidatus Saccharibacteria bacterium]
FLSRRIYAASTLVNTVTMGAGTVDETKPVSLFRGVYQGYWRFDMTRGNGYAAQAYVDNSPYGYDKLTKIGIVTDTVNATFTNFFCFMGQSAVYDKMLSPFFPEMEAEQLK